MLIKSLVILVIACATIDAACTRDKNVQFQNPLYLVYDNGFFYIQGLSNGESVVIYKHPEDKRIFGQYTFKDERCVYETVYYYVQDGKYEFTNPYIDDESNFNVTNKISFVQNGAGYEIEYSISSNGIGIFQNLDKSAARQILPTPTFKRTPAPSRPIREIFPNFANIGKQNLKVSYLKNGENFIQFILNRNQFSSIEGSYTLRTSDRRYHTIVYEIPLNDFDYNGISVKEYEIAAEENYFRTGTIGLNINGTEMNVRFYVDKGGFHINDLRRPSPTVQNLQNILRQTLQGLQGVQRPFEQGTVQRANRPVNNQPKQAPPQPQVNPQSLFPQVLPQQQLPAIQQQQRFFQPPQQPQQRNGLLNPTFVRPDLLTLPQRL